MALYEAIERSKHDEKALSKFEQLRDLVPDMTDATSVVCIATKAQAVRDKKINCNTTKKISPCIRIKRKRLEHQTFKGTKCHQRNILKGLKA